MREASKYYAFMNIINIVTHTSLALHGAQFVEKEVENNS